MNSLERDRVLRNSLSGLGMGIGLFLGGLFLTVWTWGLGSVIGIPMMIGGLVLPFWEYKEAKEGRNWMGRRRSEGSVMTRREVRDELRARREERRSVRSEMRAV